MENYGGYLGILRWSLQQRGDERGPEGGEPHRVLTEEDKAFLHAALKEASVDIPQKMRLAISALEVSEDGADASKAEEIVSGKVNALEELLDVVDDLDNAQAFLKMGGMRVALEAIRHPEEGIRRRICDVIASCLQNEPTVQAGVLQLAGLPVLLERAKEDESPAVRTQAFSAVSALVRNNVPATRAFLDSAGAALTATLVGSEVPRLRRKALFLAQALMRAEPDSIPQFWEGGIVPHAVACVAADDLQEAENALNVLHRVVGKIPDAAAAQVDPAALQQGVASYVQRLVEAAREDGASDEEALAQDEVKHAKVVLQVALGLRAARGLPL